MEAMKAEIAVLCWEEGHVPKGLMQLESLVGNSTNPDSYPFPVHFCRIKGANVETVLENPSGEVLRRMIEESKRLIADGVRAITTSCGFNAIFQRELASALPVPVFSSSLLQVPLVHRMISAERSVAVLTAKKSALRGEHLAAVGITKEMRVNVLGMEESPEWNKIFTAPEEPVDLGRIAKDTVAAVERGIAEHPETGAIVLECTDLPPFAQSIREAVGLPVFDFITLMGMTAASIGVTRPYWGLAGR